MNMRRRISRRGSRGPAVRRQIPKVFKAEGRVSIKKKRSLLRSCFFEVPETLELVRDAVGCIGQVNAGTIIRLNTVRSTQFGKLYFFDGFRRTEAGDLEWIGEFDTVRIDDIANGVGEEMDPAQFARVLVPDDAGVLKNVIGDMVSSEGSGELSAHA